MGCGETHDVPALDARGGGALQHGVARGVVTDRGDEHAWGGRAGPGSRRCCGPLPRPSPRRCPGCSCRAPGRPAVRTLVSSTAPPTTTHRAGLGPHDVAAAEHDALAGEVAQVHRHGRPGGADPLGERRGIQQRVGAQQVDDLALAGGQVHVADIKRLCTCKSSGVPVVRHVRGCRGSLGRSDSDNSARAGRRRRAVVRSVRRVRRRGARPSAARAARAARTSASAAARAARARSRRATASGAGVRPRRRTRASTFSAARSPGNDVGDAVQQVGRVASPAVGVGALLLRLDPLPRLLDLGRGARRRRRRRRGGGGAPACRRAARRRCRCRRPRPPASSATRAWKTTCSSTSPSSSARCARSPLSMACSDLVGLLDEVRREALVGLLGVPGAAAGRAQPVHGGDDVEQPAALHVPRPDDDLDVRGHLEPRDLGGQRRRSARGRRRTSPATRPAPWPRGRPGGGPARAGSRRRPPRRRSRPRRPPRRAARRGCGPGARVGGGDGLPGAVREQAGRDARATVTSSAEPAVGHCGGVERRDPAGRRELDRRGLRVERAVARVDVDRRAPAAARSGPRRRRR